MKKLIFIVITTICVNANAQSIVLPIDTVTGKITYSYVSTQDSTPQSELHKRAIEWFTLTFKSGKDVIQLNEKDKIIGKGALSMVTTGRGESVSVLFTIIIDLKDGKYKYKISNFIVSQSGATCESSFAQYENNSMAFVRKNVENSKISLNSEVKSIELSLNKNLSKKNTSDW